MMRVTLGNKPDKSVGADAGYRVADQREVFVEGGRMGNVATNDFDARAQTIANLIRGSASPVQKAAYVAVGVRYPGPAFMGTWRRTPGSGPAPPRSRTRSISS